MNICSKCGKEFEENFCPACGTASDAPKVCPKCGNTLSAQARFCNRCGYDLYAVNNGGKTKRQLNPTARKILKLLPFIVFAVWALALWGMYAIPAAYLSDGSVNLYALVLQHDSTKYFMSARLLILFGVVSCVYGITLFAIVQFRGNDLQRMLISALSTLLPLAVIICTAILGTDVYYGYEREEFIGFGPLVIFVLGFCVLFILLQIAAIIVDRALGLWDFQMERRRTERARRREINKLTASKINFFPTATLFTIWAVFAYTELTRVFELSNSFPMFLIYIALIIFVMLPCCLSWGKKWIAALVFGGILCIVSFVVLQFAFIDIANGQNSIIDAYDESLTMVLVAIMQFIPIIATVLLAVQASKKHKIAIQEYEASHRPLTEVIAQINQADEAHTAVDATIVENALSEATDNGAAYNDPNAYICENTAVKSKISVETIADVEMTEVKSYLYEKPQMNEKVTKEPAAAITPDDEAIDSQYTSDVTNIDIETNTEKETTEDLTINAECENITIDENDDEINCDNHAEHTAATDTQNNSIETTSDDNFTTEENDSSSVTSNDCDDENAPNLSEANNCDEVTDEPEHNDKVDDERGDTENDLPETKN